MKAILSTVPGLVLAMGEGLEVIAAFGSTWKDLNIKESELIGLNFSKIRSTPFRVRHIKECLESGSFLSMVVPLIGRQFECTYSRVEDIGSGKWIVVCYACDKTVEMSTDQATIERNFELAAMARARSIEDLASSVAHEINNPLMIISGSAGSVQRLLGLGTLTVESGQKYFDSISKNVFRISRIVKSIEKAIDDEALLPAELCIVKDLVQLAVEKVKAAADCSAINFKFKNLEIGLKVLGRKDQIVDALEQLILNSLAAVKDVPVKWISLELENLEQKCRIAIVDSGVGVPRDLRHKIMQPLFTTREVGAGVGLGLTIAKANVEANGGKLTFDATSANTKFVIEIPVTA
jgi:signal transduction histidine kinase